MAKEPLERGARSFSSQDERSDIAVAALSLTAVNSASNAASLPAASLAHVATAPWRKPAAPLAIRVASVVNSFGGFLTLALAAAQIPGTAFRRAVTERRRSALGAKSRFIRSLTAKPETAAYIIGFRSQLRSVSRSRRSDRISPSIATAS